MGIRSLPARNGDRPVNGVSWYGAVAYCRSRGQVLPTIYHWRRAALSPDEMFAPLAPAIMTPPAEIRRPAVSRETPANSEQALFWANMREGRDDHAAVMRNIFSKSRAR